MAAPGRRRARPCPGRLAGEEIDVVRLTVAGSGVVALLRAGSGADTSLMAAWPDGSGRAWTLSAPLRIGTAQLGATSFGPGKAAGVILNGGHGATLAGPGSAWRVLPALPAWAAALALGPGGTVDALAAHASTFTDWRLGPRGSGSGTAGSGPPAGYVRPDGAWRRRSTSAFPTARRGRRP